MYRFKIVFLALALLLPFAATGASAKNFKLEEYFSGTTYAEGNFRAINGVSRAFKVKLTGSWNGKRLKLVEDFVYDDGERDRKTWLFTKTADNRYKGTREDVIGGTLVTVRGDTARFTYLVNLDGKAGGNTVRFHDTMKLRPDGTVLNTAWVTKYGLPVAKTKIEFRRD